MPIVIHAADLMAAYTTRDWQRLTDRLLDLLRQFEKHTWLTLSIADQHQVDLLVKEFLYFFTQPDYGIPAEARLAFIQLNPVVSNVVAMSSMRTTDAWLPLVSGQPDNLVKLLTLYSPRNTTKIDRQRLFAASPTAVSLWYGFFLQGYVSALVEARGWEHLREHVRTMPETWSVLQGHADAYFSPTYIDPAMDGRFRVHVNAQLRSQARLVVRNRPHPRRIAVISEAWYARHSACRIQYEFVKALRPDYELVLVRLGTEQTEVETDMFDEVVTVERKGDPTLLAPVCDNTFAMAYFAGVGLSFENLVLANHRIAPIQVTTYGHPVSSYSPEMDYFIGSETLESQCADRYTERLVLLPGLAVVHNRPGVDPVPGPPPSSDPVIINCAWYSQKVNFALVSALGRIAGQARHPVRFRFFPGGTLNRLNHYVPFVRALEGALGAERVEVVPYAPYPRYMALLQEGAFGLDSFHFGGSNVVVDSLHMRRPVVCLEGSRWYNRIGPALLRRVGQDELVVTSEEDYVATAVRLINDPGYRDRLRTRLEGVDLDATLYTKEEVPHFRAAVDFLMQNHDRLKAEGSRDPIRVRDLF